MLSWLSGNIGTIIVVLILVAVVASIIFKMVRDRKKGKASCGCQCSHCAMKDCCHK